MRIASSSIQFPFQNNRGIAQRGRGADCVNLVFGRPALYLIGKISSRIGARTSLSARHVLSRLEFRGRIVQNPIHAQHHEIEIQEE
jgi:hypothetical protein